MEVQAVTALGLALQPFPKHKELGRATLEAAPVSTFLLCRF